MQRTCASALSSSSVEWALAADARRSAASLVQNMFASNSRTIFVALALILCTVSDPVAQETKTRSVDESLYFTALFASLEKMSKEWGHFNVDSKTRVPTDYRRMVVERDEITTQFPTSFGIYTVTYLDSAGLIDRYRKVKKEFSILKAHPAQVEGERLKVSYTLHWVSYKKNNLLIGLSDWSDVYFRYDREKAKWAVDEVLLGGI